MPHFYDLILDIDNTAQNKSTKTRKLSDIDNNKNQKLSMDKILNAFLVMEYMPFDLRYIIKEKIHLLTAP
jgi:hypothetical protein